MDSNENSSIRFSNRRESLHQKFDLKISLDFDQHRIRAAWAVIPFAISLIPKIKPITLPAISSREKRKEREKKIDVAIRAA